MKRIILLLVAVVFLAGIIAFTAPASLHADDSAAPVFVTQIPPGYRDWRLISVSHEAGNLNSIGAVLGNDVAIKAYRDGKLPYPDGTIIAALHYGHVPSAENNKVFGQAQSFVPGPPRTFSLWSKTPRSTPRRAAGGSLPS
jgi:Cytochrome P460